MRYLRLTARQEDQVRAKTEAERDPEDFTDINDAEIVSYIHTEDEVRKISHRTFFFFFVF